MTEQVDRPDVSRVLPSYQGPALSQNLAAVREQLLQMGLNTVLDQPRVAAKRVGNVGVDLVDRHDELLTGLVGDRPDLVGLHRRARWAHPHQRLVGAVVRVHRKAPVGLDQQQPGAERKVRGQPADVVHRAGGDDEAHNRRRYPGFGPDRSRTRAAV